MTNRSNQSLATGAPSQSGDLGETATDPEKADAATASDRVDEAAPQGLDAAEGDHQDNLTDGGGEGRGNNPRSDLSRDEVAQSDGEQASIAAGAKHSDAKLGRP